MCWKLFDDVLANNTIDRCAAISRSGTAFDAPVRDAYSYNARSKVTSTRRTP
jgi:hypothetical protein